MTSGLVFNDDLPLLQQCILDPRLHICFHTPVGLAVNLASHHRSQLSVHDHASLVVIYLNSYPPGKYYVPTHGYFIQLEDGFRLTFHTVLLLFCISIVFTLQLTVGHFSASHSAVAELFLPIFICQELWDWHLVL